MNKTKGFSAVFRPKLVSVAVASCFAASTALANPTGPTVVHGTAAIQQAGNLLQVTNTPNAIINWQSFSIGANEITRFIQQSQASAVLNRVIGAGGAIDPSVILGALQSNGRVFLINPSGILFGAGAQVDVAGLVASSLNLSNADFLANKLNFTTLPGAGSVVNRGNINTSSGGGVYLIGSAVTNNGIITSPQGEVILAAGNSVELVEPGTPNLRVEISAPDNEARNLGQIVADSGRVGIYAGLINNSGTIRADSAVAEGGRIVLKATKAVALESTSIVNASGAGGGTIEVLAKDGGEVKVAGRLDASAPTSGDGGFIETSADHVTIASGTTVTTAASDGKSGMWLIDPINFGIGSNISGATLSANLNASPVTIDTAGEGIDAGNITVDEALSWSSPNSLTLLAHNDILVNQSITNGGPGGITMLAGWDGSQATNAISGIGDIIVTKNIQTAGDIALTAGRDIDVSNSHVRAGFGSPLTNRSVLFDAGRHITIRDGGVVKATSGNNPEGDSTSLVKLNAVGDITVSGSSVVEAGEASTRARQANVALTSTGGTIRILSGSTLQAWGQQGDIEFDRPPAGVSLQATSAGGSIVITGSSIVANAPDAEAFLAAPGGVTVDGSSINVTSIDGNDGGALIGICGGTVVQGVCSVSSGSPINLVNGSTIHAQGARDSSSYGGDAFIKMEAAAIAVNSNLTAQAGSGNGSPGVAEIDLFALGDITLGANITTNGAGLFIGENEPPLGGIFIEAGASGSGAIVGAGGLLSAVRAEGSSGFPAVELIARNGIGSAASPIRFQDGTETTGPDIYLLNQGATGDIAVSFATGDIVINNDVYGLFNSNPAGTYFLNVESGGFTLNAPFQPSASLDGAGATSLNGQSLVVNATGNIAVGPSGSIVTTTGGTTLTSGGSINVQGLIQSGGGNVMLTSAGTITESGAGRIVNPGSLFTASAGAQTLNGANAVGTLVASTTSGGLSFANASDLSVMAATTAGGPVNIGVTSGGLTIPGQINAGTGAVALAAPTGAVFGTGTSPDIIGGTLDITAMSIDGSGGLHTSVPIINSLVATNGLINIQGFVPTTVHKAQATGNVTLSVFGPLTIVPQSANSTVNAGGAMFLSGTNIVLGSASQTADLDITATSGMQIQAGNLTVNGGSGGHTFVKTAAGNMTVVTTGNVIVNGGTSGGFAHVLGSPDLAMSVGGTVQMNATDPTAPARMESASASTINLDLTSGATSGGFFVNGMEGVISDSALGTGFYADGQPAVLGQNLMVTYNGAPAAAPATVSTPVDQAVNEIINATNQQTETITQTPGEDKEPAATSEEQKVAEGEKDKKSLPVCK